MSSCCEKPETTVAKATFTIALAGNPNSGKTTLFNALTGLRQKVANYPGVTVEKKTGRCKLPTGQWINVIDLPGTYSLISRSPDEQVAMEVLRGLRPDTPAPDAVVVVVDASNLQRNLYLVSQLIELGRPMVVALNMMDLAEQRGKPVSAEALSHELGVPVVPVVGHQRKGIEQLKQALAHAKVAPMPDWPLPDAMKEELMLVGGGLAILHSGGEGQEPCEFKAALGLNDAAHPHPLPPVSQRVNLPCDEAGRCLDRYQAIAERLLIGDRAGDLLPLSQQEPVSSLLNSAAGRMSQLGIEPMQADIEAHYRWIEQISGRALAGSDGPAAAADSDSQRPPSWSERIDAIFIHKFWGLLIFAAIMGTLFVSIFWLAQPVMDGIDGGVSWLGAEVAGRLPDGPVRDLVNDGIFAGVGAVVVFVPQIALLFFFLSILEDSGYLARAAFLMDRLLAKVGLHGKSFIPLLSSFACAIPGIMATRTIENRKDRLATIFVAPFMSCSARLPVYTLLIGTFFAAYGPFKQAGIMLALYALGIVAAAGTAWIFKRSMLKGPKPAFILELPSYKMPQASQVARSVYSNTKAFLTKAGTTIFCLSVILWAMMYYPRMSSSQIEQVQQQASIHNQEVESAVAGEQLRYSVAGRFGHLIEPAIRPLGYDWKMGVGLVGAFAAREVFVSTMGIVYSVGDVEQEATPLEDAMRADHYADGRAVWTPVVALSLLVWFVLAMQCMSTLAVVRRETGGWKWPMLMLVYMNALAYVVSLAVYQVGMRFLHG
ncbi:MAG: ferrous iron transport protein B [Phycisphaerales bacterium]|nr:ferrous iron transport protein B [Phycisphaerales bacterium]